MNVDSSSVAFLWLKKTTMLTQQGGWGNWKNWEILLQFFSFTTQTWTVWKILGIGRKPKQHVGKVGHSVGIKNRAVLQQVKNNSRHHNWQKNISQSIKEVHKNHIEVLSVTHERSVRELNTQIRDPGNFQGPRKRNGSNLPTWSSSLLLCGGTNCCFSSSAVPPSSLPSIPSLHSPPSLSPYLQFGISHQALCSCTAPSLSGFSPPSRARPPVLQSFLPSDWFQVLSRSLTLASI